jgi:acyl dehydratase
MPLDPGYVGHTFPPTTPYRVGREKIREFADAIGAVEHLYRVPATAKSHGYPDVIAPPTFAIMVAHPTIHQLIDDPHLGLDFSRVVHGEQRFIYTRPIFAGDVLVCVCTIDDITERAGLGFITSSTAISTEDGEPVVVGISKLVVRGEES